MADFHRIFPYLVSPIDETTGRVMPRECARLYDLACAGKWEEAMEIAHSGNQLQPAESSQAMTVYTRIRVHLDLRQTALTFPV